ncbi:hypothetical protein ACWDBP_34705 [Streptomyces sp. NPDC001233]
MITIFAAAASSPPTPAWLQLAVSMVGGGVVGSVTSSILGSNREGRSARARVREILFTCETLRWSDADYGEFTRALAELEAAALIAKVPPYLVARYTYIAEVARYTHARERAQDPNFPERALPLELHQLMNHTVQHLVWPLWHRWYRPPAWKLAAWKIDDVTMRLRERNPEWAWDSPVGAPIRLIKEPGLLPAAARLVPPLYRYLVARQSKKRMRRIENSQPSWRRSRPQG